MAVECQGEKGISGMIRKACGNEETLRVKVLERKL